MEVIITSLSDFYKIDWQSKKYAVIRIFDSTEQANYIKKTKGKSILEENILLMNKDGVVDVLTLFFDDIEDINDERNKMLIDCKVLVPFNDGHLHQIISFVRKYKDYDFIVHCFMGVSRSPAVAYGIYLLNNYNNKYDDKLIELERKYFSMNQYIKSKFIEYVLNKDNNLDNMLDLKLTKFS